MTDGTYYQAYGPKTGTVQYSLNYNQNWNQYITDDTGCCFSGRSWDITINGQLYQELVDDPNSGWNDYGDPLF